MNERLIRHAVAAVVMPIGAAAVLGAVVVMNEYSEPPEKREVTEGTAIEVKKAPPPKPKKKVNKPKPKPRTVDRAPPPPSLAALTGGLGGIAVEIPGLFMDDVGGAAKDLLVCNTDVVHTSDTVDDAPTPARQEAIQFPANLRKRGQEGYVLLSMLIDKTGNIERVKVLESKPPGVFDQAAIEGVQQWSFNPGQYKGEPVKTWVRQKISFKLRS